MAQHSSTIDSTSEEWSPIKWAFHVWIWILLLALFVVLEVWVDPLMASLVLCLKLGWRDLLTAIRLRGHRPLAVANVIGTYCLALACFKVAIAGSLVAVVVVCGEALFGFPPQIDRFLAGLVMLISGFVLGETMILFAATNSLRFRVRAWLDRTIYENLFRPETELSCHGAPNRLAGLLVLGLGLVAPLPIAAVAMVLIAGNVRAVPGGIMLIGLWIAITHPMIAAHKNLAQSPGECWKSTT